MKVNLFSLKGEEKGKVELSDKLFEKSPEVVLSQALRFYESNLHKIRPVKKTRSGVNISTRKIYRQKGTGGARHGAKSAPIFVGGGLAHGPSGLKRLLRLPKIFKKKALSLALLSKLKENMIFVIEDLSLLKKAKDGSKLLKVLSSKANLPLGKILIVLPKETKVLGLSNLEGVKIISWKNLNAYDVYNSKALILDYSIFEENKNKKTVSKVVKEKK
ncbi:MAG: 50S ribosomal protein L4 [Patescibacteria group bacterium]|nr:MAG: 50S ribosomal protein L4 [Patescibacteria group bacterium]